MTDAIRSIRDMIGPLWPGASFVEHRGPLPRPPGTTFALLPRKTRSTLLLPVGTAKITISGLRSYSASSGLKSRARHIAAPLIARSGVLSLAGSLLIVQASAEGSLLGRLREELGQDFDVAINIGPPRANRKPILQLIALDGRTLAFVKVGVNDLTRGRVQHEARSLTTVGASLQSAVRVPQCLGHGSWGECQYLVLAPVNTRTRAQGALAGRRTRALQELVASCAKSYEVLGQSAWWQAIGVNLRNHVEGAEEEELLHQFRALERKVGHRPVRFGASHGDWSPWNMAAEDGHLTVWDWERFATGVPVGWDSIHFAVQSTLGRKRADPHAVLQAVAQRANGLTTENGGKAGDGDLLFALYLLTLGQRFVSDGQRAAGARYGAIDQWLIPELEAAVARLTPS